jgi:hypothetical protein
MTENRAGDAAAQGAADCCSRATADSFADKGWDNTHGPRLCAGREGLNRGLASGEQIKPPGDRLKQRDQCKYRKERPPSSNIVHAVLHSRWDYHAWKRNR